MIFNHQQLPTNGQCEPLRDLKEYYDSNLPVCKFLNTWHLSGYVRLCMREDVSSILEENWLYFQTLQSNESLNPAQQNIYNELQKNECHGQHSRPVDFSITENEIRKAAIKLKNNKSPIWDKIRNEMVKASLDTDACI